MPWYQGSHLSKKWERREGRRGCSDEGDREGQELTSECVLTTPSRSLDHKHCSFKYDQDRHVYRCAWNCKSNCSVVRPKKPPCQTISWISCVRTHVHMCENISGSFETPCCFRNVQTCHELPCVRKVVTRSLSRFLLVYVTWRHIRTKRHEFIWTSVRTQETKRDLGRKEFF